MFCFWELTWLITSARLMFLFFFSIDQLFQKNRTWRMKIPRRKWGKWRQIGEWTHAFKQKTFDTQIHLFVFFYHEVLEYRILRDNYYYYYLFLKITKNNSIKSLTQRHLPTSHYLLFFFSQLNDIWVRICFRLFFFIKKNTIAKCNRANAFAFAKFRFVFRFHKKKDWFFYTSIRTSNTNLFISFIIIYLKYELNNEPQTSHDIL